MTEKRLSFLFLWSVATVLVTFGLAFALDVTEKFSIEASIAGVYQHASMDGPKVYFEGLGTDDSVGRGSVAADLGFNFHPTQQDELQLTLSFASGNGLKYKEFFTLSPNADDLESDVKNINQRDRDYLLEAWYKHTFGLTRDLNLQASFGIIDSTAYLDKNEYANDENTQFLNEVFVNNTLLNLPSYDLGGVLELTWKDLSLKGLYMASKTQDWVSPDNTRGYGYYALELEWKWKDPFGDGNCRLLGYRTTKDFPSWDNLGAESLKGWGISFDHALGELFGVFLRTGWQDDNAQITHKKLYSGGINISGKAWGREKDNLGIGYAFLDGSSRGSLASTNAIEGYARFKITDFSHITFDVQYLRDKYLDSSKVDGMIYGVRFVVEF